MRIITSLLLLLAACSASAQLSIVYSEDMGSPVGGPLITAYTGWQNGPPISYGGSGDVRATSASSGYSGASGNGNVFLSSSGGGKSLIISGINTSGFNELRLRMGLFKSTLASNGSELLAESSTDGISFTAIPLDSMPTGSGTANWRVVHSKDTLPSTPNLILRFTNIALSTMNFRLDDITITSGIQLDSVITANTNFGSPLCAGSPISIGFQLRGSFNSSNYFVAQLSDSLGDFSNAVTLDSVSGSSAGNISTQLPVNTPAGSAYRVRVSSTDPPLAGIDNGLPITIRPLFFVVRNDTICQGSNIVFNGQPRSTNGTYRDTLVSSNGCDSFITMNLTVKPRSLKAVSDSFCPGTTYLFNGRTLTNAGTYRDTLVAANGCDSIITLTLTKKVVAQKTISAAICNGSSYFFHAQALTAAGTYRDTTTGTNGCDSITILTLTLKPLAAFSFSDSICPGSSYLFAGNQLTSAGTYRDTLVASNGCDSVITFILKMKTVPVTNLLDSICPGQPYFFGGQQLQTAGVYSDTLHATNTCDSIVKLTLIYKQPTLQLQSDTICFGETYTFHGQTLTQQGVYDDTIPSSSGCAIVMRLTLTVVQLTQPTVTKTGNTLGTGAYSSYQWYRDGAPITNAKAQQYVTTQTGSYIVVVTGAHGCKDTSTAFVISGINDDKETIALSIVPNPATGNCWLQLPANIQQAETRLVNLFGETVRQFTVRSENTLLDLDGLSKGWYLIEVRSNGQIGYSRLIIQ